VDYQTARTLLVNQVNREHADALLTRLSQGLPPIPGQITSILLALKVVFEALRGAPLLERELVASLHLLSTESRHQFERGQQRGIAWPPLLDEDLTRIGTAVTSIFLGTWSSATP
jgi:hypothetical protein